MELVKMNKYDMIIYGCLIAAILCLVVGSKDYLSSLDKDSSIKEEVKSAIKEINSEEVPSINEEVDLEPEKLAIQDKVNIIQEYLTKIEDRIIIDQLISCSMIESWEKYAIKNIEYSKEIADNYYEYIVDIEVTNKDAILPKKVNGNLSTNEYSVISLKFYIQDLYDSNSFIVRKVDV